MNRVVVVNRQRAVRISRRWVTARCGAMLRAAQIPDWGLRVELTTDEAIQRLNEDHRGVERPTDVLSFPAFPDLFRPGRLPPVPPGGRYLGELALGMPYIQRHCSREGPALRPGGPPAAPGGRRGTAHGTMKADNSGRYGGAGGG